MIRTARYRRVLPALLALALAACAVPSVKPPVEPPPPSPVQEALPAAIPEPRAQATQTAAPTSPWDRLRARLAMPGCDYRPEVLRWARIYTRSPQRFAASWKPAMPFLLVVVDRLEQRGLPGEFAMLPYLESQYRALPSRGDRPAGIWQLLPDTAREQGLVIEHSYDGRLDTLAATDAALALLARYQKEFGDWRLADMAFNAGEYRVKGLLKSRHADNLSADDLAGLTFSPITHQHLAKLLALSCILVDPQRFGVTLPEPRPGDRLVDVDLDAAMDLRVAARFARMDNAGLRRYNAAYLGNRMPGNAPHHLLLPADRREHFEATAVIVPSTLWADWREVRLAHASDLDTLAAAANLPADALAAVNGLDESVALASGTRLLLPGIDDAAAVHGSDGHRIHVIRPGDTLSAIAHRYGVRVGELRRWNMLESGVILHPGLHLRVSAPASG